MYDWYQFLSKWKGKQHQKSYVIEQKLVDKSFKQVGDAVVVKFNENFFKFYNSFNKTAATKNKNETTRKPEPWERFGWVTLTKWFVKRNWFRAMEPVGKFAGYSLIFIFIIFGGMQWVFKSCMPNPDSYVQTSSEDGKTTVSEPRINTRKKHENVAFEKYEKRKNEASEDKVKEYENKQEQYKHELQLQRERLEHEAKVKKEEEKQRKLEKQMKDSALVFLTAEYVILRNRTVLRVGDTIDFEPYKGRVVKEISFEFRRVILDDDQVITYQY